MIKKLVRLALATEFSRLPLRRADISTKGVCRVYLWKAYRKVANRFRVLEQHNRMFKVVFAGAQQVLHETFGMKMIELPSKEKVTIAQKRAAQRAGGAGALQGGTSASSKSWILTSTLPSHLRNVAILAPTRNPGTASEAEYVGLYTFVVSTIYLSEGARVSEGKLERYLQRLNASEYVPSGVKTEEALRRMEKQGYIVKVREREPGGEETVDWMLGPRGKIEIGEKGVAGMVKAVYGKTDAQMEELEDKLERSLGKGTFRRKTRQQGQADEGEERGAGVLQNEETEPQANVRAQRRAPVERRSGRRERSAIVDNEAEEDEEDNDDDDEQEETEETEADDDDTDE